MKNIGLPEGLAKRPWCFNQQVMLLNSMSPKKTYHIIGFVQAFEQEVNSEQNTSNSDIGILIMLDRLFGIQVTTNRSK